MELGNLSERDNGETCGAWKRPDWQPDVHWFRCRTCHAAVPESLFRVSSPELQLCNYCLEHAGS